MGLATCAAAGAVPSFAKGHGGDTISEHPQNLAIVVENSEPKYVYLLLDTAHALAGGGDPAKMTEQYRERLIYPALDGRQPS